MLYDFTMAALPWVLIALGTALACANMDKLHKWSKTWHGGKDNQIFFSERIHQTVKLLPR